jgi:hypothetical protein
VVDQFGTPVSAATVTLSRSDVPEGPFEVVPNGSSVMSFRNRVNPAVTDVSGRFSWDVVPGWYEVGVRTAGGVRASTGVMQVPPERLGLLLEVELPSGRVPTPSVAPSIGGTASAGSVVTLSPGVWPQPFEVDSVTWKADGQAIGQGLSLTVPAAVAGKTLSATLRGHQVVAGNPDGITPADGVIGEKPFPAFDYQVSGVAVAPVVSDDSPKGTQNPSDASGGLAPDSTGGLKSLSSTPVPLIAGQVRVGQTVSATVGAWDAGVVLAYQWYAGGQPIAGAAGARYVIKAADKGVVLTVRVTGTKAGYLPAVTSSAAKKVVAGKLVKAPKPTVTGKARVGAVLKAKAGKWDAGVVKTYRWYAGGKKIAGATKAKYKIAQKYKGKAITVKVTGKKTGYAKVVKTSKKTAKVRTT